MSVGQDFVAVAVGVVAGVYAGLLGVGGGIVMVPAMVLLLDKSQHVAEGTSLLVIVATALVAARSLRSRGLVIERWVMLLAGGGMAGAVLGSFLAVAVIHDETLLRKIYGSFLLAVAAWIALRRPGTARRHAGAPRRDEV